MNPLFIYLLLVAVGVPLAGGFWLALPRCWGWRCMFTCWGPWWRLWPFLFFSAAFWEGAVHGGWARRSWTWMTRLDRGTSMARPNRKRGT